MDNEVEVIHGTTKEPSKAHFQADQKLYEAQGMTGKSPVNLLSEREGGLFQSRQLVEAVVKTEEGEKTLLGIQDFLPPILQDQFDDDGYLSNPEDNFWGKTSCYQTAAIVGIPSVGQAEIQKYEDERKGTVQLILDKTRVVNANERRTSDIILFKSEGRYLVHACNFVATSTEGTAIVLSRDGKGPTVPIRLRKMDDVITEYSQYNPNIYTEYRRANPRD